MMVVAFVTTSFAQKNSSWDKWDWLIGSWKGEGSGNPGQGSGKFSFSYDLNNKILVRKAHSEYTGRDNSRVVHDDLLIIYPDFGGNPSKAIYFDGEGHVINYSISYNDKSIVLLSEKIEHVPTFRLTYTQFDGKTSNVKFEMSQDGTNFKTYVEGKSVKE